MITYVNKDNSERYRILYAKATLDLMTHNDSGQSTADGSSDPALTVTPIQNSEWGGRWIYAPETYFTYDSTTKQYSLASEQEADPNKQYYAAKSITSLNEYFSYIEALARINPVYTVLPVDEDVFEIDANTRQIKVPDSFNKNGISVQGDEISEIIYFRINRFYDAIDLATKDIYIQWKSAAYDEDGQIIEGVSVPWCVDVVSQPNYIIFGWPVSSKITKAAGEISFAVRFYEFENDTNQITYSLSTLTQKVQIKPALDFDILNRKLANKGLAESTLVMDDNTNLIVARLENSTLNESEVKAEDPYFLLFDGNQFLSPTGLFVDTHALDSNGRETTAYTTWLEKDAEDFRVVNIPVSVQATSDDGGKITYAWKKYNINNNELESVEFSNTFIKTTDTEKQNNKTYYVEVVNGSNDVAYQVYGGDQLPHDEEQGDIFEKYSTATITGTGKYIVCVSNRLSNSTAKVDSFVLYVREPVKYIADAELQEGEISPFRLETNVVDRQVLRAGNEYTTTISVVAASTDQDKSKFTYQWKKKNTKNGNWVPIEGATSASLVIADETEGHAASAAVAGEGDGYYQVTVTNNLNKVGTSLESAITRVTHPASTPIVNIQGRTSFNLSEASRAGLVVNHEVNDFDRDDPGEDTVLYQWYRYRTGTSGNTTEDDVEAANRGEYTVDNDTLLEGETNNYYYPSEAGLYFCEVTNKYNNDTASKVSRFFTVTDA